MDCASLGLLFISIPFVKTLQFLKIHFFLLPVSSVPPCCDGQLPTWVELAQSTSQTKRA